MRLFHYIMLPVMLLAGREHLFSQTIVPRNGQYGLADERGNIFLEQVYDTIYQPAKGWRFFIAKRDNKYAYAIRHDKNDSVYWRVSPAEFDTLYIHSGYADNSVSPRQLYTVIAYRQNGLAGFLTVEYNFSSGGGIFTLYTDYYDVGAIRKYPPKYDALYRDRIPKGPGEVYDEIYTTVLNGRYGFLDLVNDVEVKPQFDTAPVFAGERLRYVRDNGRWGLVRLSASIGYDVPCSCYGLGRIGISEYYYCRGANDTLKIFNAKTKRVIIPATGEAPVVCEPFGDAEKNPGAYGSIKGRDGSFYELKKLNGEHSLLMLSRSPLHQTANDSLNNFCYYNSRSLVNTLWAIDPGTNTLLYSFTDTTARYDVLDQSLIVKAKYDRNKKKYVREFFDAQTGKLKFAIETRDRFFYVVRNEAGSGTYTYSFSGAESREQEKRKNLGRYDPATGKFTKK